MGDQLIDCVELTYDLWCHYGARLIINHNLLVLLLVLTSDHPISDDLRQITYCCDGGTKKTTLNNHILTAKMCVEQQEAKMIEKLQKVQKLKAKQKIMQKMLEAQIKLYAWLRVGKALQKLEEVNEDLQLVNDILQKVQDERLEEVKLALEEVKLALEEVKDNLESLQEIKEVLQELIEELQEVNLQDFEEIKLHLQRVLWVTKDQNSS